MPTTTSATAIGTVAIALWALLALLVTEAGPVPSFQLTAMTFGLASAMVMAKWAFMRQNPLRFMRQPPAVWAIGVGGLFGYHAAYFVALRLAPPVEASLLNYLWPLLIVLFSAFLPGQSLSVRQVAGALLGLAGCVLVVTKGGGMAFNPAHVPGYLWALAAAFIWAGYSVLSRRFGQVPTDAVGGFCVGVTLLALAAHLLVERTVWPTPSQWAAILALGLGPVGAAFFAWDIGMKRGDIGLLGVLSYATPLLSTALLVLFGRAEPTWTLGIACALIAGGALLAARRTT
jgi:drug/metabolite transporter (DMT)-like permease